MPRRALKTSKRLPVLLMLCWPAAALALSLETPLPDPGQEARARALFQEIRCAVCEGEAVADSPAEIARDVRRDVRLRIAAGDSDETITGYLVSRYGDHILMRPPLKPATALLWFGPLAVLAAGLWTVAHYFRKRSRS